MADIALVASVISSSTAADSADGSFTSLTEDIAGGSSLDEVAGKLDSELSAAVESVVSAMVEVGGRILRMLFVCLLFR